MPGTQIYTDEYNIYSRLEAWGYPHKTVNHSAGEYARDEDGDGFCEVHSNTIEGFWSLLRSWLRPHRGISQDLYLCIWAFLSLSITSENVAKVCCLRYLLFWLKRPQNLYRASFFNDLRALTRYFCFDSWQHLMEFMLDALDIPIPTPT